MLAAMDRDYQKIKEFLESGVKGNLGQILLSCALEKGVRCRYGWATIFPPPEMNSEKHLRCASLLLGCGAKINII